MRQANVNRRGNNKNRPRKTGNPLTRSYDSNGPDVKIRGTASHIADKYMQLARDAQVAGDEVMAENYMQHAEHYLRILANAQNTQPSREKPSLTVYEGEEKAGLQETYTPEAGGESVANAMPDFLTNGSPEKEKSASDEEDAAARRRHRGTRGRGFRRPRAQYQTDAASEENPAQMGAQELAAERSPVSDDAVAVIPSEIENSEAG